MTDVTDDTAGLWRATGLTQPPRAPTYPFDPPQPVADDALEPWIGAATLRLQRDHHLAYARRLNELLASLPHLQEVSVEILIRRLDEVPELLRPAVRDAAVGHANHQFYWKMMRAGGNAGTGPSGRLLRAIEASFGSVEGLRRRFNAMAAGHIGAGWAFVAVQPQTGDLQLLCRPNNGSVMDVTKPGLLICDLWEHAYCLQYGADRRAYLEAFWHVVDWDTLGRRLDGDHEGKTHT